MATHEPNRQPRDRSPSRDLIFTVEQMRRVDEFAIWQLGIPGLLLMEHAAMALREGVLEMTDPDAPVVVLVGPGNNGGDGLALARLLHLCDPARTIRCVLLGGDDLKGEAGTNLAVLRRLAEHSAGAISVQDNLPGDIDRPGLIVDAMFGSGLTRPLEGRFAQAVEWTAHQRERGGTVFAVDVPSGLSADTGRPVNDKSGGPSPTIRADATVTLGGMKVGLVHTHSPEWTGTVSVGDIGVPRWVLEKFGERSEDPVQG